MYDFTVGKAAATSPTTVQLVVQVSRKDGRQLRDDLGAKTSMCWCMYSWNATISPAPSP